MILNLKVIELIAKLAIEVGEDVIPKIINDCHPTADEELKKKYQDEVRKKLG